MSLREQIDADIKKAMLNKNQNELTALRSIKSAILLAQSEKGSHGEVSQEAEAKLLMKAAKQRKDSAQVFKEQGRDDLAEKELSELEIIERYLPEQMSEEELKEQLSALVKEIGASGPQDMGKVMGIAMKKFSGKADGKMISGIVKDILS